ncbi:MAG: M48 family metalloprotease [Bacteroidota bacterium]
MRPLISTTALLCLAAFVLTFSACREELRPTVKPSEFSKVKREQLGDRIRIAIAQNPEEFPVLPKIPPYNSTVYWYIQTLFNQLNSEIRADRNSPISDRWTPSRTWEVTILDMPEVNAFIVPGGHFYITTGMLRKMEREYELYYVMAFELSFLNEKWLINQLFSEYTTSAVAEVAASGRSAEDDLSVDKLAMVLSEFLVEPTVVQRIDESTASLICQTSRMDRSGIIPLLEDTDANILWLNTRSNYSGRIAYVLNDIQLEDANCGSFKSNGGFEKFVLDHL